MQTYSENQSKTKLITTVVTIIVIAGVVVFADHLKSSKTSTGSNLASTTSQTSTATTPASSSTSNTTPSTTNSSTSSGTSSYKDGTYTASSSYYVPNGNESIKVTVAISNGVVTNASVANSEGDPTSAYFQQDFASNIKNYVVGQKIANLRIGVISGASDTSQGFNDALSQIASQAQA